MAGTASRKVNMSGFALDDPQGFQSTTDRPLIGFLGREGFLVLTKFTETHRY